MSVQYERDKKEMLESMGFYVQRAAGSQGADLFLSNLKNQFVAVEVKSVKKDKRSGRWCLQIGNTEHLKEQYTTLKEMYTKYKKPVFYEVRWKNHPDHRGTDDEWDRYEIFFIGDEDLYITRSNQKWPVYEVNKGLNAKSFYEAILDSNDVLSTVESLSLS